MKKYIIIFIVLLFTSIEFMAQGSPPPPPGGTNGGPTCWPPSPDCNPSSPVPINEGLWLLVLIGGGYLLYKNKKELNIKLK